MYFVDFLPVENEDGDSSNSGDAIALQFTVPQSAKNVVVVIDAGTTPIGDKVADHVKANFSTSHIDLLISTHPDTDHLNGILTLLERCTVGELMMHKPWNHHAQATALGNYERIVKVYDRALELGITVSEPFTGDSRFNQAIVIMGPTKSFYDAMLADAIERELSGASSLTASATSAFRSTLTKVLNRTLSLFPTIETLSDDDDTSARNKSSVITLLRADSRAFLFTGDAGISGLDDAATYYEAIVGPFATNPLYMFQAPHHGSHHNLGPTILNRILGPKNAGYGTSSAVSSSAKSSEKHPSPKVTNAIGRRGPTMYATEGKTLGFEHGVTRGWTSATPIGPLEENDD